MVQKSWKSAEWLVIYKGVTCFADFAAHYLIKLVRKGKFKEMHLASTDPCFSKFLMTSPKSYPLKM